MSRARLIVSVLVGAALALAGCETPQRAGADGAGPAVVRPSEPPDYGDIARRYNERLAPIDSLYSAGTVRLTYLDEERTRREEQGDTTVQVVLPDRLALSLKKAGRRLFWLGGDEERYWWFDLVDGRTAIVGRHDTFDERARDRIGLAIHPLDLIRVLGILPLPVAENDADPQPGATQWSNDGRLLGVTTRIRGGGYQRLWLDPESLEAQKIELFDDQQRLAVVADLGMYGYMPIEGIGGGGPRVAHRLSVADIPSGTEVRLTMDAPEGGEGRISPDAFDFETLRRSLGVQRVINLDEPQAVRR